MIKGTPELIAGRREEIINACEQLYQTISFRDITIKDIGNITSFSRPTIYNYFETKEEIFLALFEREYDRWNTDLDFILQKNERLTRQQVAEKIALSLQDREQLLKLLSMNNFDMEANSRKDLLVSFKRAYGKSIKNVQKILEKFCPELEKTEVQHIIYIFFPFMFGIYPYTKVTEKQRTAMTEAEVGFVYQSEVGFVYQSIYEITYNCLIRLLKAA